MVDADARVLARAERRLAVHDVDAARTIYYAAPYIWAEAIWSDWLAREAKPLSEMFEEGCGLPAVASSAEYRLALRLDEIVELVLRVEAVGRTSVALRTEVCKVDGSIAVVVRMTHVFVTGLVTGMRPAPLPAWLGGPLAAT